MKAKELAQKFIAAQTEEEKDAATAEIIRDFWSEVVALKTKRNPQTNEAVMAIFNELETKWKAMCRVINDSDCEWRLKETGFRYMIAQMMPDVVKHIYPEFG